MFGFGCGQEKPEEGVYDDDNRETHYDIVTIEGKVCWFISVFVGI